MLLAKVMKKDLFSLVCDAKVKGAVKKYNIKQVFELRWEAEKQAFCMNGALIFPTSSYKLQGGKNTLLRYAFWKSKWKSIQIKNKRLCRIKKICSFLKMC